MSGYDAPVTSLLFSGSVEGASNPTYGDFHGNLMKSLTLVDSDTFLTTLYVMIDDFYKWHLSPEQRCGAPGAKWVAFQLQ